MLDNYISVLQERRKYFTGKELSCDDNVVEEMLHMDERIQEFGDRVMKGDKTVLAQIQDVMNA